MNIQAYDDRILLRLNGLLGKSSFFDAIVEFFAIYSIYTVPVILVFLWFRKIRETSIRAALAGLLTWLVVSPLIATVYFRARPELAQIGGQELLFHRPTYSFPSDHAGFLAALTVTFYLNGYKKIAIAFLMLTIVVSFVRVTVGFHYPTDILGGWVIGTFVALAIHSGRNWLDRYISRPAIRLAQQFKLA
jgi:membrane-associated phospholipid phosphatase